MIFEVGKNAIATYTNTLFEKMDYQVYNYPAKCIFETRKIVQVEEKMHYADVLSVKNNCTKRYRER